LTHGWGGTDAILAGRLAGIRRILHFEDGFLDDEKYEQKTRRRLTRRYVFQAAERLVVPSRNLRRIARTQWKVPRHRLMYVPNGVDTERFQPGCADTMRRLRQSFGYSDEAVVIGTVGALRLEKNQLRLVCAFARLARECPAARLFIVGDGPLLEPMKRKAASSGIENLVTFVGRTDDPSEYYQLMDIFALSSDTEQMPLVVLEAMAAGLPVVSTDVGDVRKMLTAANRKWVCPMNDQDAYCDALRELTQSRNLRSELGRLNRDKCLAKYSMERMLRTYISLFQQSKACIADPVPPH
jgi:glycosyltransferase involved in cell wall biosynthesis